MNNLDLISINDMLTDNEEALQNLKFQKAMQQLEDPLKIKKNTENYLNIFKDYPYIFNLGHGVLPETNPMMIDYLVKIVNDY